MGSFLIGLLGQIASLITGTVGGSIRMVTSLIKDGFGAVLQYNQQGVALARQMGLNAQEAQAYTQVLITRAKDLGHEYGIAAEQVLELQKNLSNSTGRALMLNNEEAERMVQINKLVGAEVGNQFTSEMMNHMGAQLSTVQGAVSKAYATAAKSGLSAAEFSAKVAKNLSMANKLSFRDGVNGIIRMTALSEKLGFNLQSVESAADKFMELDKAIESSAQLQMLGGAAGAYGSNPLTMAYEANYDPEAFTKRMTNTLGGYATFDAKTGMANVNGMNRDFVKAIAQAIGISMDEAMSIAKKQAEIKYKENAFGSTLGNYSKEQQDFILNKSYVDTETGHLMMTDVNNNPIDISKGELTPELIKEMQKFDNTTEKDLMAQQAKSLKSIEENLQGWLTSAFAGLAEALQPHLETLNKIIDSVGQDVLTELVPAVANFADKGIKWLESHSDIFTMIYDLLKNTIVPSIKWVSDHIGLLVGFWLGGKAFSWLMKMPWGAGWGNTVGGTIMKKIFGGGGGGAAAAATTSASGAAAAGGAGAATAARGASAAAAGASSSVSVPTKANPHIFKYSGQTYQYDGQKYRKVLGDNKLGGAITKNVNQLERARLSDIGTRNANAARAAANQAANTTRPAANTAASAAKSSSRFGKFLSKIGKVGKVGGGAVTVAISSVGAGLNVNEYNKTMEKLTEELEKGRITQEDYNKLAREAKNKKNESLGSGIGSAVGGIAGSFLDEFLGPFGTILGAMIGDFLGGVVGKAWNGISNTVADFWNGTVRNIAEGAFGKAGTAIVDAVSEVFDGMTTGFGTLLEGFFGGLGTIFSGLWDGVKTQFNGWTQGLTKIFQGDFIGGLKTIFTGMFSGVGKMIIGTVNGFWSIIKAPFLGAWEAWKGIGRGVGKLWDGVVHYFNKAGDAIKKGWDGAMSGLSSLWGRFRTSLLNQISPENKEKIKAAIQKISEKWESITNTVSELWNSTINTITTAWDEYIVKPATTVWNTISNAWNEYVATPAKNIWNGITNIWNEYVATPAKNAWDAITGAWNKYVVEPWTKLTSWVTEKLSPIFEFFDGLWKGAKAIWDKISNITAGDIIDMAGKGVGKIINWGVDNLTGNAEGGIIGGDSYSGDKVVTRVNSGEMVLNMSQQNGLFNFIKSLVSPLSSLAANPTNSITNNSFVSNTSNGGNSNSKLVNDIKNVSSFLSPIQNVTSLLTNNNDVKAKPVGDKEYIYTPKSNTQNGVTELTVRDINLNINGTLKLDGGNNSRNIDINQLLNDTSFVSQLKDLITQSINTEMNGGRFLTDNSTRRGGLFTSSWGLT